jgi:uncharacterized membrane protein
MNSGRKTWKNEITIIIITLGILLVLVGTFSSLFNYLRSLASLSIRLVSPVDYRLAFLFAILAAAISSGFYLYLLKRWLRLKGWRIVFRFVFLWSITSLLATMTLIDNEALAFQAAQVVASAFFGGVMVAMIMLVIQYYEYPADFPHTTAASPVSSTAPSSPAADPAPDTSASASSTRPAGRG